MTQKKLTESGDHIVLHKSEYEKLVGEAESAKTLRQELEVLKGLAQSALGNIGAVVRRVDSKLSQALGDDEDEVSIQNVK